MKYSRILIYILPLLFPTFAHAAELPFGLGETGSISGRMLQMVALITIVSLAPSILVMMTSFTRIIVVLSFLRSALGVQQTPPNNILISLALFLTLFVMMPTFETAYEQGILPLIREEISEKEAIEPITRPFHHFMIKQARPKDIELFMTMAKHPVIEKPEDTPFHLLLPAFMISELRRAFEIGFLIFLPFLVIDLLISSILMAMGMMMLPPVMISLPFKIIFFVMVDGWYLICGSLIKSFVI